MGDAVNADIKIAELEERCRRYEAVLRALLARADNWGRLETSDYYRQGLRQAYSDVAMTALAGLNYAAGTGRDWE